MRPSCAVPVWILSRSSWILTVTGVLAGASCMDEKKPRVDARDTNAPDLGDTAEGPVACDDNTDCAGGEVCRDSWCRTACDGPDDCATESPVCDLALGFCVMCVDDSHCGPHEACDQRVCNFFCRGDEACETGSFCDLATGACLIAECEESDDCVGGFRCEAFRCVPIDPIVCAAATIVCIDGGTAVRTCSPDGTSFDDVVCDPDFRCVDDADGIAECRELVCAPNDLGCLDETSAFVCDGTGTLRTALPCAETQYCQDGACWDRVCVPGSSTCEGESMVTCDALGAVVTVTPCSSVEACIASEDGCRCSEGQCEPRACTPGGSRCVGSGIQQCLEDGTGYGDITACGQDDVCAAGACLSRECVAGSRECVGETLLVCSANGTDREASDCAVTQQICTGSGATADCTDWVCTPNERRCDGSKAAVLSCDARGAKGKR